MKKFYQRSAVATLGAVLMLPVFAPTVPAQTMNAQRVDPDKVQEAREEVRAATEDFRQLMRTPDDAIPRELFERAEAIAVFPNIIKAAFIIGGRGGDGIISRRTAKGWSAPAFFNLGGGSFGAQIGVSSTDLVMLFMNEGASRGLLEDKFEFGAGVGIAAGPVGRMAGAATNLTLDAGILTYSRSKGLFAGASLNGAVINPDNNLNEAIYGVKAREVLLGNSNMTAAQMPDYVSLFPQTLAQYSGGSMSQTASGTRQRRVAPDDSEITVEERDGVRIETRTFRDPNSRVQRVEVTTDRDGKKTTRVYGRNGEVRELPENVVVDAFVATGETIAAAAGFVASNVAGAASATREGVATAVEATGNVASETAQVAGAVASQTVETAKTVGSATVEGTQAAISMATTVGEKTADVAGTVINKTVAGTEATVETTKDVAGAVAETTTDAGSAVGNFFKSVGRGFKRVFGI